MELKTPSSPTSETPQQRVDRMTRYALASAFVISSAACIIEIIKHEGTRETLVATQHDLAEAKVTAAGFEAVCASTAELCKKANVVCDTGEPAVFSNASCWILWDKCESNRESCLAVVSDFPEWK